MFLRNIGLYNVWLHGDLGKEYPYSMAVNIDISDILDYRYFQIAYACLKSLEESERYGIISFIINVEKVGGMFLSRRYSIDSVKYGGDFFLVLDSLGNLWLEHLPNTPCKYLE